ncbi:MAG: molybdenum cofactor guanylyltransferase [Nitrospirae bacterium]|nr:molybdenum cofactor guanylyltransferase [Nitrospirota bacterium]
MAGGENRRIPFLKGRMEINSMRIIDSSIGIFKKIFDRVVISTNMPELYFYCGVPMIGDVVNQRGPMTGIFSVLLNTRDDIFVVGCDMPFIDERLIRYMVAKNRTYESKSKIQNPKSKFNSYNAVIPLFGGKPEPLFGIYSRNILKVIEERLNKGLQSIIDMLKEMQVLYISEEDIRKIDPEGRSFVNINTMEDYASVMGEQL